MEPEQKRIVPDFGPKIKSEQARWLARIARDQRVEPFFGNRGLELVKSTRGGIEKGIETAKDATRGAGRWLSDLKWVREGKEKISAALSGGETPEWLNRFDKATEELRQRALSWGGKMGGAGGDWSLAVLKWGFELVLYEDTEAWALGRVNRLMPQAKVTSLAQMALLEEVQREAVIAEYYPYDNPTLKRFSKSLDWSLNLALGAAAASQLPGSGLAAGLANLAKTLIKLAGRISSMSAVYGYHIPSAEHLFVACAKVLKSIEDFEANPEHLPLAARDFAALYLPQADSDAGFGAMLKEALKKEAYMAVPGVGVISLGKIGLDDLMVDQMVLHLVGNVFWLDRLELTLGAERAAALLDRWSAIYGALLDTDWFGQPSREAPGRGWQERLWAWSDAGEALSERSAALDFEANRLFEALLPLSGAAFWQELKRQVKPLGRPTNPAAPPEPKLPAS